MAKVRFAKVSKNAASAAARATVTKKRVRTIEGDVTTLRTLDAGSTTFGSDLTYVFGKNVEKARRENKRVVGTADLVPTK